MLTKITKDTYTSILMDMYRLTRRIKNKHVDHEISNSLHIVRLTAHHNKGEIYTKSGHIFNWRMNTINGELTIYDTNGREINDKCSSGYLL